MKRGINLLLVLVVFFSCSKIFAQEDDQAMMAAWMEFLTPTEFHAEMAKYSGDYSTVNTMWMGPGKESVTEKGEAKLEMILGGRYLKTAHFGSFMGTPFEGVGIDGYDNVTKEVTSVWFDNMGTGTMIMKGSWDKETGKVSLTGTTTDPLLKATANVREVVTYSGGNKVIIEMYNVYNGVEYKSMEMVAVKK
ncbi:MAG: DUF1579 domain-containing protein [Melioribacteraceae bacterium]|nr:DUF1579 domain-containing protein [Melioribacteraceae bacterium]